MGSEIAETVVQPEVAEVTRGDQNRHPTALWFFFWGEFAERCSYYGMRAILPLYLSSVMAFSVGTAGTVYSWFKMTCYFLPLVGGFLADRFFGRYWTIVGFSVPYVLGHFILGIPTYWALFFALGLLAGGSGVIKPNISTLMGQTYDQYRPGNKQLRSAAFLWFYFSINVGAFISLSSLPWIRDYFHDRYISQIDPTNVGKSLSDAAISVSPFPSTFLFTSMIETIENKTAHIDALRYAYPIAFQFPAWLMVMALIVFALGKPYYGRDSFERPVMTPEMRRLQWDTLGRLFGIFALIVLWWVAYEQNDNQWVFFSRDYVNLDLPFKIPYIGSHIAPDQIQSLNALFVLIFVPFFTFSFKKIDPEVRFITATKKMLVGFSLQAVASGLMALAGYLQQSTGAKVSILWVVSAYIVLTAGEVLLYGTGLELAYTMAPAQMKGFVTACFLLTNTLGNFINGFLSPLYGGSLTDTVTDRGPLMPGAFFLLASLIALAGTIGFYFVAKRFDRGQSSAAAGSA